MKISGTYILPLLAGKTPFALMQDPEVLYALDCPAAGP